MSSLYVYTTEGACIYPDGGSNDASINRYFESVNFVVDTRDQNSPSIEAYFRAVLPSGRPEQLFLRFQGEDPSTLFEDCRRAVREELVTANGWQIQQTDDTGDPSMVFQRAVLDPAAEPDRVFENTPLAGQQELLRSAIRGTRSQFAVSGRNYQAIADAVRALDDTPAVMAVADGDISLSGVDLSFSRARQQYDLALPRESKQVLQQVTQQDPGEREQPATEELETQPRREAERIESELSTISDQLQSIRDADVSQSTVREQLDSVVSEVYPSLSVSSRRESALAGESRSTGEDSSAGNVGPMGSQEGRFSGLLPNVSNSVAIGAVAGAALVVLVLGGVVFGGGFGGNSGSGDAEFEVDSLDVDDNVTAGDDLEIRVEVENVGDDAGDETVTVDAEGLGVGSLEFSDVAADTSEREIETFETTADDVGEYTITAEAGNNDAETTVTVEEADDPAEAELTGLNIAGQDADATINEGDNQNVSVNVENVGEQSGSFEVTLEIEGTTVDETELTDELGDGEDERVTFEAVTSDLDEGEYEVNVFIEDTADVSVSGELTVEDPGPTNWTLTLEDTESADFDVEIDEDTEDSVDAGDSFIVTLNFTEVGDVGEIEAVVEVDGVNSVGETEFTPTEEDIETIELGTESTVDSGDYDLLVTAEDDEKLAGPETITVN